jgi:hypothetical protein
MRRRALACLSVVLAAVPATGEILEHVVFTPTSLPSDQGWSFHGNDFEEGEVAAIVDGVLVLDTMDGTINGGHTAFYRLTLPLHEEARFLTCRIRARVLQTEHADASWHRAFTIVARYAEAWANPRGSAPPPSTSSSTAR